MIQRSNNPLDLLRNVMTIRRKRWRAINTPLEGQEPMAFAVIQKHFESQVCQKLETSPEEAATLFQALVNDFSQREILAIFLDPPEILGVHYQWFVINAIVCMAAFVWTHNFSMLLIVAPALHILGVIYYRLNRKRFRQEKINQILIEGLKI